MKINEVERQVGITKKNIRFYEEQGLLSPRRNKENGYREYDEEDVRVLEQIKLLRKLGLPLEEIRLMQAGTSTVADSMRRHLVTLERESQNLKQSVEVCNLLKSEEGLLRDLPAAELLEKMEQMEQGGTSFQNKQIHDVKRRYYVAPAIVAVVISLLAAGVIGLMVWGYMIDPEDAPPLPLMVFFCALPLVVIGGVLLALAQRIGEIQKGEMDDARKY